MTVIGFLDARSVIVMLLFPASVEITVAAMFLNEPETMPCAVNSVPSSFLVPRARTLSPTFTSASVAGLASSNLTESGE